VIFRDPNSLPRTDKLCYSLRAETNSATGGFQFRIVVLYDDGRMRPLEPQFRDEPAIEAYMERWTPELIGKKVELLQMVAEKTRGHIPAYGRMQRPK
jgi:hypothetical protein